MSSIIHISTAVPEFQIKKEDLIRFYSQTFAPEQAYGLKKKLELLSGKTKINTRYSVIPDFNGNEYQLYNDGNYKQPIEKRMKLYREKIMPLATKVIDDLLEQSNIKPVDFTHLITVSCTGLMAPGLEFLVAEHYGLEHTEKSAVNFLGCYAALKALKQAHYIAQSNPEACILILSAELCSLHFYPSDVNEDIVANLLFSDGAAGVIVCGDKNPHVKNKVVLQIDEIGSAFIPNTSALMTWDLGASAFRMFLSSEVVDAIKNNIQDSVKRFPGSNASEIAYWAIHPGGVKIVEACQESLGLNEDNVEDSLNVLKHYGNMSSPTILFILNSIFNKIRSSGEKDRKKIFSCAFGPGLNIEMISLSSVNTVNRSTSVQDTLVLEA